MFATRALLCTSWRRKAEADRALNKPDSANREYGFGIGVHFNFNETVRIRVLRAKARFLAFTTCTEVVIYTFQAFVPNSTNGALPAMVTPNTIMHQFLPLLLLRSSRHLQRTNALHSRIFLIR